jgi:hypothetical protein
MPVSTFSCREVANPRRQVPFSLHSPSILPPRLNATRFFEAASRKRNAIVTFWEHRLKAADSGYRLTERPTALSYFATRNESANRMGRERRGGIQSRLLRHFAARQVSHGRFERSEPSRRIYLPRTTRSLRDTSQMIPLGWLPFRSRPLVVIHFMFPYFGSLTGDFHPIYNAPMLGAHNPTQRTGANAPVADLYRPLLAL